MANTVWPGCRVLVTGHTGFKGSWMVLCLRELGAAVSGYSLPPPTDPSLFDAAQVVDDVADGRGDVRDLDALEAAVAAARPNVVFHLAAQPLVRHSYRHPVETYETNVMGTVNVLEAARRCRDVQAVVIVTSDKCYANREWLWGYRETEAMGGSDPYSSSKGCAELIVAAYRNLVRVDGRRDLGIASVRAGNVIGGGDWAEDRLVPDVMRAFQASRPVAIRCPNAVRPWQHVLEPVHGYLMLAERLLSRQMEFADAWNFGPATDCATSVAEIVAMLADGWGTAASWEAGSSPSLPESNVLRLDCTKARTLLGWRPLLDLPEALAWTSAWYRACGDGESMREFTLNQVREYQNRFHHAHC